MRLAGLLALAAAVLVVWASAVFVDETEFVIITQFGDPIRTLEEAGLCWKLPYQSALRIDRRLQIYNPRPSEFLSGEKKNVNLDVFVCWRVEKPEQFLKTVTDVAGAEARIHDVVWSGLAAEVSRNSLDALVSTEADKHRLEELVGTVRARCAQSAGQYGIEVVDVRIKRIGIPAQVRDSVFQRMSKERARMARQYRAEGEAKALIIRATADKNRTVTLAKAYAEAEQTRGAAEAKAIGIYAQAHQKDPAFYELLRTLESYKKILDEKTSILLSGDSELLKFLTRGSMLNEAGPKK